MDQDPWYRVDFNAETIIARVVPIKGGLTATANLNIFFVDHNNI